jgi:hypothetical protein
MESRNTRFTEEQTFPVWAYLIFVAGFVVMLGQRGPLHSLWLVAMALVANLLYMRTEVNDTEVTVSFGWVLPLYQRHFRLEEIVSAESVSYSPLGEFGGWGIRGWGKNVALNARGDRGVRLTLRDGSRVLVGSQRPDDLATAIRLGTFV